MQKYLKGCGVISFIKLKILEFRALTDSENLVKKMLPYIARHIGMLLSLNNLYHTEEIKVLFQTGIMYSVRQKLQPVEGHLGVL